MNGGELVYSLSLIAAVVDPDCVSGKFQVAVADIGKVFAPVLDFSTVSLIQFPGFDGETDISILDLQMNCA